MEKKLRLKFVLTAMSALCIVLILIIGVLNVANLIQLRKNADELLGILAANGGTLMDTPGTNYGNVRFHIEIEERRDTELRRESMLIIGSDDVDSVRRAELPFESRYFSVLLDDASEPLRIDTSHIATVTPLQAANYAAAAVASGKEHGFLSSTRFYIVTPEDGLHLVLFTDVSSDLYSARRLFLASIGIGAAALFLMLILVWLFSGRAVAPAVESMTKQKRFITDAGHELKTPLSVISANVDVLELESGSSEWTQSIRGQVKRMTSLVSNMLTLSRMDEESLNPVRADVDFSAVVSECVETFRPVAEANSKTYESEITPDLHVQGDATALRQLLSLLIDNAMKYSATTDGLVRVRLRTGKRSLHLSVINNCDPGKLPEGNLDRLFDRFYRADESRSRSGDSTGGFGIGLSVARAIATSHGGTIEALRDGENGIRFLVKLPPAKALPAVAAAPETGATA